MNVQAVFAQATVSDLSVAEQWYGRLFERGPDSRPMDGLIEWHFGAGRGVQVWSEPDRAGRSTVVVQVDDIDRVATRLQGAGLAHDGPQPATSSRVLPMQDPDGNRVVVTGA